MSFCYGVGYVFYACLDPFEAVGEFVVFGSLILVVCLYVFLVLMVSGFYVARFQDVFQECFDYCGFDRFLWYCSGCAITSAMFSGAYIVFVGVFFAVFADGCLDCFTVEWGAAFGAE